MGCTFTRTADRDPQALTTLNFTVIRAAVPSVLGDESYAVAIETDHAGAGPANGGTGGNASAGTTRMLATAFNMYSGDRSGVIDHVVLHAVAYCLDNDMPHSSGWRWQYRVGSGSVATCGLIRDADPTIPPTVPLAQFNATPVDDTEVAPHVFIHSPDLPTRPDGQPWTWADLDALTETGIAWEFSNASTWVDGYCHEMWVEVWGAIGSAHQEDHLIGYLGHDVREDVAGDDVLTQLSGPDVLVQVGGS